MSLRIIVVLAVLTGVTGSSNVTIEADSADMSTPPNSVPDTAEETHIFGQVGKELDPMCVIVCNHFAGYHLLCSCIAHVK